MRVNCGLWWPTFGVHVNDNDCNQSYYFLCVSKLTHPESVVWHIRMVLQRKKHWLCHTCTSCSYQSGGAIPLDMRQTWKRQTYISGIHSSTVKTTPQLLQAMSEVTVAFVGIMHMNLNSDASDVVELVHSNELTTFLRNTIVESADKCWSKLQIHTSEFARKRKQKKKVHFILLFLETQTAFVPYSCRCHWCTSRRVGNTPPISASVGLGSGESGWILSPSASGDDTEPYLNTTSGWWPTRSQRCWRTLELGEMPDRQVSVEVEQLILLF